MTKTKAQKFFSLPNFGSLPKKTLLKRSIKLANDKDIITKAAAVAYFSMIAMVPIIVVVISLFSQLVPTPSKLLLVKTQMSQQTNKSNAINKFRREMGKLLPQSAYKVIDDQIERINEKTSITTLSLSLFISIWTSSSLFATIFKCMDEIHEAPETRNYLQLKIVSISVALVQSSIFVLAIVGFFLWPVIEPYIILTDTGHFRASVAEFIVFAAVVVSSFTLMMHIGPTGKRYHPIVTPGAIVATPVFMLTTWLFRLYVQNMASYHEMYGPLGGVMILMIWFWVAALVLLSGTTLDRVIAKSFDETFAQ